MLSDVHALVAPVLRAKLWLALLIACYSLCARCQMGVRAFALCVSFIGGLIIHEVSDKMQTQVNENNVRIKPDIVPRCMSGLAECMLV